MKKFNIHYSGFFGWDIVVEAENYEQALSIADHEYCEADYDDFFYETEDTEGWEVSDDEEPDVSFNDEKYDYLRKDN